MQDLTKQRFGRLIVVKQIEKNRWGHIKYLCKCDCGRQKIVVDSNLKFGSTKSCGCLVREGNNTKHGHKRKNKRSTTYQIWTTIIQRCTNPNHRNYSRYGGRGVTVCERWKSFENFLIDMGERPPNRQIDRINNNGGYDKKNCRWTTPKQNGRNRQNNRLITFNYKTQCLSAWAEQLNIHEETLRTRLNHNWPVAKALTTPVRKKRKN